MAHVVAVVVTFRPDLGRFAQMYAAIRGQVQQCIVVDNGSPHDVLAEIEGCLGAGEQLISLRENMGIAAAQNAGIAHARRQGADHVLLLDQDSIPPPNMVRDLLAHLAEVTGANNRVAAIGPRLVDGRWKSEERLRPKGDAVQFNYLLEVDHVIASGALLPLAALNVVGDMREDLFIDFVDIEWCLRASQGGYRCFIATDVLMDHQLGKPMKVLGRTISTHSPMRHYYLTRNSLWMMRQAWLPARWRLLKMPKIVLHLLINAVFAKPHREHWRMMARGVRDGLRGRMGKGHE